MSEVNISDVKKYENCLFVGFDSAQNGDDTILAVFKIKDNKVYIENMLKNEKAIEMYDRLIGVKE